jgi:hypothetical protein
LRGLCAAHDCVRLFAGGVAVVAVAVAAVACVVVIVLRLRHGDDGLALHQVHVQRAGHPPIALQNTGAHTSSHFDQANQQLPRTVPPVDTHTVAKIYRALQTTTSLPA